MAVVGMRIYPGTPLFANRPWPKAGSPATPICCPPVTMCRPDLTAEAIFAQLQEFSRRFAQLDSPATRCPAYLSLVERLRKRGVVGPLWSYFSMVQRLWPHGPAGGPRP